MSVEDKQLGREVSRELNRRRQLDISDVRMSVTRGVAYIGGTIRASVGEFIDPKVELKSLQEISKRVPGLRDLVVDVKFELGSKR
ncbi:MAG TPA: hypothetical protein VGM23_14140 [Armatimonadota bacterium]|jgi:osmotically-inducible protein OsmY